MSSFFERRSLGRDGSALVSTSLERAGFLAAFTERGGGVSAEPFDSLNLSQAVGDDDRKVRANRERVLDGLRLPRPFTLPEQVHGGAVERVDPEHAGSGFDDPSSRVAGADALVTASAGVPLAILAADCLPVAMASPSSGLLAVVHAGWRGLAAGILARTAALFGDEADVVAAIGPAIGPDHYEVGEDVARAVGAGSGGGAVTGRRGGRLWLDMAATARNALRAVGIERVDVVDVCTACEPKRFFSHRHDRGRTGRQGLVAVRL